MNNTNIFDEHFNLVSESRLQTESIRSKLIEGVLELNEVKRINSTKQKELKQSEVEISKLKTINQQLIVSLMEALIEKEELLAKKTAMTSNIARLNEQIENMERESNLMLCGDEVEHVCQRYSTTNQLSILNKIQDAKCKLIKYGFPPSHIQ